MRGKRRPTLTDDPSIIGDARMYVVDVVWCPEGGVYVGTSEDIPGLTLEAATKGEFLDALMREAPHLIDHNIGLPEDDAALVKVQFSEPQPAVAQRGAAELVRSVQRPRRYMVEDAHAVSA